jgi:hypothetical protein
MSAAGRIGRCSAFVLAGWLCGCVGLVVSTPAELEVKHPGAHKSGLFGQSPARWACERPARGVTKSDFVRVWGRPERIVATAAGETWTYGEDARWCGAYLLLLVPVPLMLPVCRTFDEVDFVGETALRSRTRRMDAFGAGITFMPTAIPFPIPFPFALRNATADENQPAIETIWSKYARRDLRCPAGEGREPPPPERLNAFRS